MHAQTTAQIRPRGREGHGPRRGRARASRSAPSSRPACARTCSPSLLDAEPDRPALVVAGDDRAARDLAADLKAFLRPAPGALLPGPRHALRVPPGPAAAPGRAAHRRARRPAGRRAARGRWSPPPRRSPRRCPTRRCARTASRSRRAACSTSTRSRRQLVACGYERVDQVEERGQFAVRGDILDVYPATEERAVRCELFDVEVERLTWFSTFTQRSLEEAERVEIAPAAELGPEHRELAEIAAATRGRRAPRHRRRAAGRPLPRAARPRAGGRARGDRGRGGAAARAARPLGGRDGQLPRRGRPPPLRPPGPPGRDARPARGAAPVEHLRRPAARVPRPERRHRRALAARGRARAREAGALRLPHDRRLGAPRRGRARPATTSPASRPPSSTASRRRPSRAVLFAHAGLREGFLAPPAEARDPARAPAAAPPPRRPAARARARGALASFTDLRAGAPVVHEDHGIARFTGFETKTVGGITRDYLELEFRDGDRVFVPSDQLHKISRYVGADAGDPQLSKLGGKQWEQQKLRARRAAEALAGELINLYAERKRRAGHAVPARLASGRWSSRALPLPRDARPARGDRGRARRHGGGAPDGPPDLRRRGLRQDRGRAARRVQGRRGRQAGDVPRAHHRARPAALRHLHASACATTRSRSTWSRASARRRRRATRSPAFERGEVDILIGTHRLLSRDVRPKDLGLLIVDEEQRFGVKQKELLRQLKLQGRRALAVGHADPAHAPDVARRPARHLGDRDAARGPPPGQDLRRRVRRGAGRGGDRARAGARGPGVLPAQPRRHDRRDRRARPRAGARGARARWPTARWPRASSRSTMLDFLRGEADVLVCTTIVESGLDIPSANTLIVERADQFGLAQLYQIRGRVGRSRERAYAYLLYPEPRGAQRGGAASASRRCPTTPSSAPASRSRCATSRSAAPATCSARSSRATWRRSASSSTWGCSTRPCGCWRATRPTRPPSRCGWTCPWTPTCRATTCPTRRPRSRSTGAWPAPARSPS